MFKKFKENFIKSTFIYKFYRYFRYKRNYHTSFAAMGEDILLQKIFRNCMNGFYIDVGALHPVNGSLTYNLSKNGWNGINLDLTYSNIKLLKFFRRRDISIQTAISSKSGIIDSYIFDEGSGLNTLEKKWADKWKKSLNKKYSVKKISKITLNDLLQKHKVKKEFELLNIDVEGHEYEVLKGINLKIYRPKIITVEIHVKKTDDIFKSSVFKILKKNNYELISHYYLTSFFKSAEFEIQ